MSLFRYSDAETSRAISQLVPIITREVKLLSRNKITRASRSEHQALTDELATLRDFVRSAKAKSEKDKRWLFQLKEVAKLIENLPRASELKQWTPFLRRASSLLIGAVNSPRDQASNLQIKIITFLLREINERGQMYKRSSHKINDIIVGLELQSEELVRRLMGTESKRSVISLVGIGGIGKTTLARKVYNELKVKRCFDCVIWISMSRFDNLNDSVTEFLRSTVLSNKRYLVVFDDVWSINFWQQMKLALPDEDNGSRVIVTTRNRQIAGHCSETSFDHVHYIKPLLFEDSLVLFFSKVFGSSSCPHRYLENMSYEFVRKCHGWPIAIVALAVALSFMPRTISDWGKVLHLVNSGPTIIDNLLRPIFESLPYNLKLCFLYFGIYPENYVFGNSRLFKLWVAEGFIEQNYGLQTLEQVAEKYLDELVRRHLVMQESKGFFQVHDAVFHFAQNICQEFNFYRYLSVSRGSVPNIRTAFWSYLRLSFSHRDRRIDSVPERSYSGNNPLINDDAVDIVPQASPSSDRWLSDYDLEV